MTTTALLRSPMAVAIASDRFQSLGNDDGTETIVPGSKIFQMSDKVLGTCVGRSGLVGISYRLVAESIYTLGVSRTPVQDAQFLADHIVPVNVAAGRSVEELTQNAVCGMLATLNDASDGALFAPFKALSSSPNNKEATKALKEVVALTKKFVEALPNDDSLAPFDQDKVKAGLMTMKKPALIEHVGNDQSLTFDESPELTEALADIHVLALTKSFDTRDTGILTFAGFGPDQVLPSFATLTVVAAPAGELIYSIVDDDPAQNGVLARAATPAQDSAQQQLIHGITHGDSSGFVGLAVDGARETFSPSDDKLNDYGSTLESTLTSYFEDTYTTPFLRVIRCLDEPGLARVADLLARVQEFRAVASNSQATVGGVIEVATITKRDGIRWHRRSDTSLDGSGASVLG